MRHWYGLDSSLDEVHMFRGKGKRDAWAGGSGGMVREYGTRTAEPARLIRILDGGELYEQGYGAVYTDEWSGRKVPCRLIIHVGREGRA